MCCLTRHVPIQAHGGVYADLDAYALAPLDSWRRCDAPMVLGLDAAMGKLNNGVMLAAKNASFLRLWRESYREYRPRSYVLGAAARCVRSCGARATASIGRQPWSWSTCSRSTHEHAQCSARCMRVACAQCTYTVAARHTAQAGAVGLELVQPQHGPRTRVPAARCDGARARPAAALPPPRALCAARAPRCGDGRSDGFVAAGGAPHGLC